MAEDQGLVRGLRILGNYMSDPSDTRGTAAWSGNGPKGAVSLYYLWSLERVGVFCNVRTIGGKDWYRWGVDLLLPTQKADGSWVGRGSGGSPVIDTCFALLFLKRSDLLPDLRETLQKRVTISDPGLDPKGINAKKGAPAPEDSPLTIDFGEVPVKAATARLVRVRGPEAFRITGVRGTDDQLQAKPPSLSREVQELALTLRPDKSGNFRRTIYLVTDIPGRAEVAVQIEARVSAAK